MTFQPKLKQFEAMRRNGRIVNAMSVDVEDYFQVQALESAFDRRNWDDYPSRVERNTNEILDLFGAANVKATFFTLGWVAERWPGLVRRMVEEGHEVASHGYAHFRADSQTPAEFAADVRKTKDILEQTSGQRVIGYRAASFSIGLSNLWAFSVLAEAGYLYSSSVNPIVHDNYGIPDAPRFPFFPEGGLQLEEYPVSTLDLLGHHLPCGGGGYFRLFPYIYSHYAVRRINEQEARPSIFYFHPWEIDPDQPVVHDVPLKSRLRHYTNLSRMAPKLARLLDAFEWGRVDEVFFGSRAPSLAERVA